MHSRLVPATLLAGLLGVSPVANAQRPTLTVRALGDVPGLSLNDPANNLVVLPSGGAVIYTVDSALYSYRFAAKVATSVARGRPVVVSVPAGRLAARGLFQNLTVSPAGDRLAWNRPSIGPNGENRGTEVWSMPVDPRTGYATGPAGLLTAVHGAFPRFSPDGKSVAFFSGERKSIMVVPALGGPERVIAPFSANGRLDWSVDGKSIFYTTPYGADKQSIDRYPATGGAAERVFNLPEAGDRGGHVWATNGRAVIYLPGVPLAAAGGFGSGLSYRTSGGATGELPLPPGAQAYYSSWTPGTTHAQFLVQADPAKAYTLDLTSGKLRDLDPAATASMNPVWSTDGARLAFIERRGVDHDIVVTDRTGGNRQVFAVHADPRWTATIRWSPDDRLIAFGSGSRGAISILDVQSGKAQVVSSPSGTLHALQWRRDGRSLLIVKNTRYLTRPAAAGQPLAIYEVGLHQPERLVRDLSTEFMGFTGASWISDSLLALASADKRILVPVFGGAARTLPGPGYGTNRRFNNNHLAHASTNGQWLLTRSRRDGEDQGITGLTLLSAAGDSVTSVQLPFDVQSSAWEIPLLRKGGESAVVLIDGEEQSSDSRRTAKVYLVPLRGGSPRLVANLPGRSGLSWYQFDLSPDGNTVALTLLSGPQKATMFDLDLGPLLRSPK